MKNNVKRNCVVLVVLILFLSFGAIVLCNKSFGINISEKLDYNEKGTINYKVYLDDNSYYNKSYLDEGMQYISSIIDYIDINYNYTTTFSDTIDYNINTKAEAIITIVDTDDNNKVIYSSIEELEGFKSNDYKNNVLTTSKNYKIDYARFNKLTNEFKTRYGISAKCDLKINFYVNYSGSYKKLSSVSNSRVMSVDIPLSEQMINITKGENINNSGSYTGTSNKTIINKVLYIVSILFAIIALALLVALYKIIIKASKQTSKYEKFISKTLRQYDSYITEADKTDDTKKRTIVRVNSFKELFDVRNSIEKTIIYIKVSDTKSKFEIIDTDTIYCYEVSEEDFE